MEKYGARSLPPLGPTSRALLETCIEVGATCQIAGRTVIVHRQWIDAVVEQMVAAGYELLGYDGYFLERGERSQPIDLIISLADDDRGVDSLRHLQDWEKEICIEPVLAYAGNTES